jgi:hypothetical protein
MPAPLSFRPPAGASEPREIERWFYYLDTGVVRNDEGKEVMFVAASRMDQLDVSGNKGRAERTGYLGAAAPDMYAALKVLASCNPNFPPNGFTMDEWYDAVRAARAALAKAEGRTP